MEDWQKDLYDGISTTEEEVEHAQTARQLRVRDGGVCVCGHGAFAHTENVEPGKSAIHDAARLTAAGAICAPSRVKCGCLHYQQVLIADDLRQFRHSTMGPGRDHALMQGIGATIAKGRKAEWVPGLECIMCHRPKGEVNLTVVAYNGRIESRTTTQHNVLICEECRKKIKDSV